MGKIASPGVLYCDGEGTASLSVNGDIVSTQNPPISYTLSGTIATVSDALGVVGTFDLSGALVEVSRHAASPNTPYCGGNAKSALKWNTGFVESNNPPISYQINLVKGLFQNSIFVRANTLTPVSLSVDPGTFIIEASGLWYDLPPDPYACDAAWYSTNGTFDDRVAVPEGAGPPNGLRVDGSYIFGGMTYQPSHVYEKVYSTGTGNISLVIADGGTVSVNTGGHTVSAYSFDHELIISDSTGEIFRRTYRNEPTGFQAICYDYDISEVSYACTGCPSGTLFECTCPATNTKYCYGFDPDNPDVFKSLFESPIA